jgi:hypothetical protein
MRQFVLNAGIPGTAPVGVLPPPANASGMRVLL